MYKKVELPKSGFVGIEKDIADFWKEKDAGKGLWLEPSSEIFAASGDIRGIFCHWRK